MFDFLWVSVMQNRLLPLRPRLTVKGIQQAEKEEPSQIQGYEQRRGRAHRPRCTDVMICRVFGFGGKVQIPKNVGNIFGKFRSQKWRKTFPLFPTKTALCRVKVFQHIRMTHLQGEDEDEDEDEETEGLGLSRGCTNIGPKVGRLTHKNRDQSGIETMMRC